MPGSGRSPAQIDADVARFQEGIRQARAAARAAGPAREGQAPRNPAEYHEAVAEVARATRGLVDYEEQIPAYQRQYREEAAVRVYRRSGGLLAAVSAVLCLAVLPGLIDGWWLVLLGPLLLAGLAELPGARRRAADLRTRPRVGAGLFALAALIAVLCSFGAISPWAAALAPIAAVAGLRAFGTLLPAASPGFNRSTGDERTTAVRTRAGRNRAGRTGPGR